MKDTLKALHQVVTCQSTSPVNSQQFLSGTLTPNALLVDIKRGPFRSPLAQKQVKMFLSDQSKTNLHGKVDEKLLNEIIFVAALKAYQRNMVRCSSIMLERAICIQIEFHGVNPMDMLPFFRFIKPVREDEMPTTTFWMFVNNPAKHTHLALC